MWKQNPVCLRRTAGAVLGEHLRGRVLIAALRWFAAMPSWYGRWAPFEARCDATQEWRMLASCSQICWFAHPFESWEKFHEENACDSAFAGLVPPCWLHRNHGH